MTLGHAPANLRQQHGDARRPRGFTLVEVLVALVIAAILASGLLASQRHGLNQARQADVLWLHLNTAQEALMGRDIGRGDSHLTAPGEMLPDGRDPLAARITTNPPTPERPSPWVTLATRQAGREMEWSWPTASP
jgi:prepilin-type N-terminal cleavage/methylation domain-containing protein